MTAGWSFTEPSATWSACSFLNSQNCCRILPGKQLEVMILHPQCEDNVYHKLFCGNLRCQVIKLNSVSALLVIGVLLGTIWITIESRVSWLFIFWISAINKHVSVLLVHDCISIIFYWWYNHWNTLQSDDKLQLWNSDFKAIQKVRNSELQLW